MVPATAELLAGWTGPVWWLDTFRNPEGKWIVSAYGAGGMANGAALERIRLDTSRPEVIDRIARVYSLPDWQRASGWAPALTWFRAMSGRPVRQVDTSQWRRDFRESDRDSRGHGDAPSRWVDARGWRCCVRPPFGEDFRGPETGDAGKAAADLAALAHDCALIDVVDGREVLTLPPLVAGGEPLQWSPNV